MSEQDEKTTAPRSDVPATSAPGWQRKTPTAPTGPQQPWKTPDGSDGVGSGDSLRVARHRIHIGILLALFLALAALFVYYVVLLPAKTRLIAAVAVDYRWPLIPNGWAQEDIDGLKANLGDQTLSIVDVPLAETTNAETLAALSHQLEIACGRASRGGAVVIYLSAHGVVDGRQRPCLLLPDADPLDSSTWLRIEDLLAAFKSLESRRSTHYLLILDGNRQRANWNIGLLDNDFANRIREVVAEANLPGLAVLNSASPGQLGHASMHLRGSVFGYYLRLGLAGAADDNRNNRVSLHELHRYLQKNVNAWVYQHRAARQIPVLYPADAPDFPIAWSLNRKDLRKLTARPDARATSREASAAKRLARLWQTHRQIEAFHPNHYAPAQWHELEHQLLWLEQAALAGEAYHASFERTFRRLDDQFNGTAAAIQSSGGAPVRLAAVMAQDETLPIDELDVYSLALAEYLGTASSPDAATVQSDAQLLKLFDRYRVARLWPDADPQDSVLERHRLGERLSVPCPAGNYAADARAHGLVHPLLDGCDRARRNVEDGTFVGPQSTTDLPTLLEQVTQRYEKVSRIETAFSESYQVRDRAWAELPYLGPWVALRGGRKDRGPRGKGNASLADDALSKDEVLALINMVNRLDQVLQQARRDANRPTAEQDALLTLASSGTDLARQIEALLDGFHERLLNEAQRLALAPATPETLREITSLLAMPLVSGGPRGELYARYVKAAEEVDGGPAGDTGSGSKGSGDPQQVAPVAELHPETHWLVHPVAGMLGLNDDSTAPADAAGLAALGGQLREALRQVVPPPGTAEPGFPVQSTDHDGEESSEASPDLLEMERRLRRLIALRPALQPDPFQLLRRRQLQNLLLWHCQRKLDDFWGSAEAGRSPYFAEAAQGYLAGVQLLARADVQVERSITWLNETLDHRREAARRGLATTSTDLLLIDEDSEAAAQVGIRARREALGLPTGVAAVYLRDENSPIPSTVGPLEVGPPNTEGRDALRRITIALKGQELVGHSRALQAVAMFRGHEFPAPLTWQKVAGAKIEVDRHRYGPSRITLRGSRLKRAEIVFILDCSHSMEGPVDVEVPDTPDRQARPTKLKVAIDALRGMMERLGERGDNRVGVRFFGHRVGWLTDQSGALARQEAYPEEIPPTLRPYEDVELFLPLGRFDSVTAGVVNRRLETLKPWGESPIYLSLIEALQDFGPADAPAERRVVVITDGVNYQFNPPPESALPRSAVEEAYAGRSVGIDIVGFAIPEEERSAASNEFGQLALATGGSFTAATNASSLIRTLEQLLTKASFRVVDDDGRVLGQAELGGTVVVHPEKEGPCSIEIEQLRATTVLEGGEALQLAVSVDGRQIVALPYEERAPIFAPLVTPAPTVQTGYRVGAHRPLRTNAAAVFPISFQRDDLGIPSRPGHVWIEVLPMIPGQTTVADRYVFFDDNYEPELPVPLLNCRCCNWPNEADKAEVRVWCLPQAVEGAEVVPLESVVNRTPPSGEGFELDIISGVSFQARSTRRAESADRFQVRVVQRHAPGTAVNALKLELRPRPSRILHQFDWDRGIVLHTFEYDSHAAQLLDDGQATPPLNLPSPELRFQTRDQLIGRAWRLQQPITLGIAEHNEVIAPSNP